jgi:glutamate-ammonia-ligase adenylyltransferase
MEDFDPRGRNLQQTSEWILSHFHISESITERLKALGFRDGQKAGQNLRILREGAEKEFPLILPALLQGALGAPDPEMALNNFERFVTCDEEKANLYPFLLRHSEALSRILTVFGSSQSLSYFLMASPRRSLEYLAQPALLLYARGKNGLYLEVCETLRNTSEMEETKNLLRRFRKWEYVRIMLRDLLGQAELPEITQDISDLADVCLQAAHDVCDRDLREKYGIPMFTDPEGNLHPCRFTIIGMGKSGGGELNYSSDIDLIFLYSSDNGETTGIPLSPSQSSPGHRMTNHEYFVKLSESIVQVVGATTSEGVVFRVDTRLRPEGEKGDLACSLRSYEIYYESWGQTWERAALLKARPIAGDEALGQEFLRMIQPFIYRKYLDFRAIEEIRDMKRRINRSVALKGREMRDVKLGYGGIREIEFFIQALQLLYGGREPWVRERNSLRALHRLAQKGLMTYEEEDRLSRAYHFLRRLEHRIQFLNEQQTHSLPDLPEDLYPLARRMGNMDGAPEEVIAMLRRDYHRHTRVVRTIYDDLFAEPEATGLREENENLRLILEDLVGEDEGVRLLSQYPFQDPRRVYRNILLLRDGAAFSHQSPRSRQIFIRIFPEFFNGIIDAPDPDLAVNHLESFISAVGARETFYTFFQNNPQAIRPLAQLLGNSEYLSRLLIRHPDLVDLFLDPVQLLEKKNREQLRLELFDLLKRSSSSAEKRDILRRFKYTEEVRIGMMDIQGVLTPLVSMTHLSLLADLCVEAAVAIAIEEIQVRHGHPLEQTGDRSEAGFSVVAVGKFGGEEMTYGSDLDLFFLYSQEGQSTGPLILSNHEYFSQLASKIISILTIMTREGTVFKVDVRLRPSGSKGPLAQSLEAVTHYLERGAEVWEHQVLTRARMVAGSPDLGRRFLETCHRIIYPRHPRPDIGRHILDMRKRMEKERSKEDPAHYDIKVGPGGIVDIEFLIQYFQLTQAGERPEIRKTHTLDAMEAIHQKGLLTRKDFLFLKRAILFLRTLESRLRIVSNFPSHLLPRDTQKLRPVARRMGYSKTLKKDMGERLLEDYLRIRRGVRERLDRLVQ